MTLKNIFFLLCPERCGSNLILRMVDSHPECMGPGATHLFRIMLNNLSRYGNLLDDTNWRRLVKHTVEVFRSNKIYWKKQFSAEDLLEQNIKRDLSSLIYKIYEDEAQIEQKQYAFIKENKFYEILPFTLSSFPKTKYIYMTRDPRDMALSFKKIDWYLPSGQPTVRKGTVLWKNDNKEFIKIYLSLKANKNIFFMKYENLLDNPEQALGSLCDFLELKYNNSMLKFHTSPRCQGEKQLRACYKNLSKPLIRGNKSKYKTQLSEAEIRWVEYHCSSEMDMLGYDKVFGPTDNTLELEKQLIEIEHSEEKPAFNKNAEETAEDLKARIKLLKSISAQKELPIV